MTGPGFSGQVAVVAGATGAVGRAVCIRLAGAGARLCLLGRKTEALESLVKSLPSLSNGVDLYPVDLTVDAELSELRERLAHEAGRLDILIHSAGTFEMGAHSVAAIGGLDQQYRTNVRGPYLLTQALLPLLREYHGQVVFMNSTVGLEARAGVGQYASTQHALRAIADALRAEINADGVRVLSIYLGRTATARQARIFQLEGRPYVPELLMQPDDVAQMVTAALLLPRTAEVTEIRMRPLIKSY